MSRILGCLGLLSVLCLAEGATAGQWCSRSLTRTLHCTRCAAVPCCCVDDYCRKPLPCIPGCATSTCCDDYCRKPLPCLPSFCLPWCPDDYCRKPLPHFCWPVHRQFYRCPPDDCQAADK